MADRLLLIASLALVAGAVGEQPVTAKVGGPSPAAGVTVAGSPYRYAAFASSTLASRDPNAVTIVTRTDRRGGRVSRWWRLRGRYYVPAAAAGRGAAALSADGGTLVLSRNAWIHPPRQTGLAILDTHADARHPRGSGDPRPGDGVTYVTLPGGFSFHSVSPDGSTVHLVEHLTSVAGGPQRLRALDARTGELRPPPLVALPGLRRLLSVGGKRPEAGEQFLDYTQTPRRPGNTLERIGTAGRSAQGRPIALRQLGDPAIEGEVLVFGCIHGDECAARGIRPAIYGCPDPSADIYLVPNLDPDGAALGTRLNGRGVDLNRNFASQWRPIGERRDPQHAGPRPFSEPETRLAARIVRRLQPEVTIWFHQYRAPRPLVRAWGGSADAAGRFARLARLPFRRLPWPAGTAPNWQNHRFPQSASFVVELPQGALSSRTRSRLERAVLLLAREVGED